jgi:cellulose synthase operon protein C
MSFERILVIGVIFFRIMTGGIAQPANSDLPLPIDGPSPQRPSFLPLPGSKPPRTDPSAGGRPRTIRTVIELPVPEPVAGPPAEIQADPAPTSTSNGGKVKFGDDQENQSPSPAASQTPDQVQVSPVPQTGRPIPESQGKPAILFGEEDQPLKQTTPQPTPVPRISPPVITTPVAPPLEPEPTPDVQTLIKQKRFAEAEPIALEDQDAGIARALGWGYYNLHNYSRANTWFQNAISWNEDDYEAAYGLALVLTQQGDYDRAESVARWRLDQYPAMRKVMGDLATMRAMAAYKRKEYRQSIQLFADVETYRGLTRDEQIVQAWNYFQAGDYPKSAQLFESLYVAKPDKYAASGVYASYAKLKNWPRIAELSKTYDGPLAELYQTYLVQRYYDHRLYANAYAMSPQKYPELAGYTSPVIAASGFGRFKSGDQGTSKLRELRADAAGSFYQDGINRLSLDIGLTSLNAGNLPAGAFVGQVPLSGDRVYQFSPKTSYQSLVDMRAAYQRLGFYTPTIELGISPVGGALDPTLVGKAELAGVEDWGNWDITLYRNSVKQSILSYTGFKDPYSGTSWGRVSEDGLSVSAYDNLSQGWGLYGQAGISILEGEDVETNNHLSFALSLNRQIENPNFTFMTVGPAFSFEHYAQNEDFFTFGHGGYFSPDYIFQGAVAFRFLTKEARSYLIKGEVLAGLQTYKQDSAPIFPLELSVASYPGTSANTFIATARLAGLFLIASQWGLGASVEYSKTANYSEFTAAAFLRFFFEPRNGLFEGDF